jgi:hypothetical protein
MELAKDIIDGDFDTWLAATSMGASTAASELVTST